MEKTTDNESERGRGLAGKPLHDVIKERRATRHFRPDRISDGVMQEILSAAGQAPSGYNFQPWRFVVVRAPENLRRLRAAARNQAKVGEASAVVVTFALRERWVEPVDDIVRTAMDNGARAPADVAEVKRVALASIAATSVDVWLTRQVMIGFTHLMLAAESFGWDTAPMEGFDERAVREVTGLPDEALVVALLAIGRATDADAPFPGRLSLEKIAFSENFSRPWAPEVRDMTSIDHGEENRSGAPTV